MPPTKRHDKPRHIRTIPSRCGSQGAQAPRDKSAAPCIVEQAFALEDHEDAVRQRS